MNVLLIARIVVVTIAFSLGAKLSSMYYGNKISLKDKAIAESILKSEKANREIERLGFELMNNVALLNIERNKESEILKVEVVKKVIEYVQSPNSGKCDIPASFVRIHNSATGLSQDSESSSATDGGAEKFTDVDLLPVIANNYATCIEVRNQLLSFQDWARELKKLGSVNE